MKLLRLTSGSAVSMFLLTGSLALSPALAASITDTAAEVSNKVLPQLISQTAAIYPGSATNTADQDVVVSFTVDEQGRVRDLQIVSSPSQELEAPAKKAVAAWRFTPGTREGRPAVFKLKAPVTFKTTGASVESAPVVMRKVQPVYPYEQLIKGQSGWGESSFVVDYSGRAILAAPTAASDSSFAKSVTAMIEASEFTPAKKEKHSIMISSNDRQYFAPESSFDAVERQVLSELRKDRPAIYTTADLDARPKAAYQQSAVYPRALKSDGMMGQAEIEFVIDRDGRVLFPRIVSASHEDFGWAAATAVAQWKFNPPMRNGQRVDVRMTVPVLFDAQKLASSD